MAGFLPKIYPSGKASSAEESEDEIVVEENGEALEETFADASQQLEQSVKNEEDYSNIPEAESVQGTQASELAMEPPPTSSEAPPTLPPITVTPSDNPPAHLLVNDNETYPVPSFMMKTRRLSTNMRKSIFKTATKEREQTRFAWATNFDFSLVSVACVVGITNFVGFPQFCKKYGGLAFCIPYITVVVFMGLPLYFLETLLGQYSGHGTVAVMNELVPAFVGIGYALVINNFVEFMRNELDVARILHMTFSALKPTIPWAVCDKNSSVGCYSRENDIYCRENYGNNTIFYNLTCTSISSICVGLGNVNGSDRNCQQQNGSSVPLDTLIKRVTPEGEYLYREILNLEGATLAHLGPIEWLMFCCLAACWALTYVLSFNGFSTTANSAYLTVFAPVFGQFFLFLKAFTLEGAGTGIKTYLSFDATSLASKDVWLDAIRTCFTSLSLGLGLITAVGSASKPYKNCLKTSIVIICVDTFVSLVSGLGFFALMGHLAFRYETTVEDLLAGEQDVVYTALPTALVTLSYPRIYTVIFFASTALMSYGYLAAVIAMATYDGKDIFNSFTNQRGDEEKTASNLSIYQFNIITCTLGFTFSILFVTKGGTLVLEVTDVRRHIDMSFIIASLQTIVICFFYGSGSLLDLVEEEMGIKLGKSRAYWALSWNILAPCLLLWAAFNLPQETDLADHEESNAWHIFGLTFAFYPLLIVVSFFSLKMYHYRKDGIWRALQPTRKWCLGLDTGLFVDAEEAEPEVWKTGAEEPPSSLSESATKPTSLPPISGADQTEAGAKPLTISPSGAPSDIAQSKKGDRSKSIFSGRKAMAIIGHTIKGNSYVPFERQIEEGQRIRRKSQGMSAVRLSEDSTKTT